MVTEFENLVLADLSYLPFKKAQEEQSLREILKDEAMFIDESKYQTYKRRWLSYKKYMKNWKVLKVFDLIKFEGEMENKTTSEKIQYRQFFAVAFISPSKEIVVAFRGTDGDNGLKESILNRFPILSFASKLMTWADLNAENLFTNAKIFAGVPGIQFDLADRFLKEVLKIKARQYPR